MVAVLVVAAPADRTHLTAVAMLLGAALGLLVFDLREELMLGDAGSNVLGAIAGLGVVLTCGLAVRVVVLLVVVGLNLASERVSFSRVDRCRRTASVPRPLRSALAGPGSGAARLRCGAVA